MTIAEQLKAGEVGVLATDTLYGLVGSALSRGAVERIYKIKRRDPSKALIVLIADIAQLKQLGVGLTAVQRQIIAKHWPGPVSIVFPCDSDELSYLHRGLKAIAVRLPDKPDLRELIRKTGPLVAPSANPEGMPPAETVAEAKAYFGNQAAFYAEGEVGGKASKLVDLNGHVFRS